MANSSPKERLPSFSAAPKPKKRSLEDVFLEVTQELPDATQGPKTNRETTMSDRRWLRHGVRIGTTEYRRTLRGLRQDSLRPGWWSSTGRSGGNGLSGTAHAPLSG